MYEPRRAKRREEEPSRDYSRVRHTIVGVGIAVAFAVVIWGGARLAYSSAEPVVTAASKAVAAIQVKRLPYTPTPTVEPTRTPTPTATPIHLPEVPGWFNLDRMTRYAGIVMGETWSITDTETMIFLATQIMYDAEKYQGKLPVNRWKGYAQPSHLSLQAVNVALMNIDKPLYPKCKYIGGLSDSDYFNNVAAGLTMDYYFGNSKVAVVGWSCK